MFPIEKIFKVEKDKSNIANKPKKMRKTKSKDKKQKEKPTIKQDAGDKLIKSKQFEKLDKKL